MGGGREEAVEWRMVEESGFRRRLVCGAFTGVGPSFILPLRSVNTYPPVYVCVLRARAFLFLRMHCLWTQEDTRSLADDNDDKSPLLGGLFQDCLGTFSALYLSSYPFSCSFSFFFHFSVFQGVPDTHVFRVYGCALEGSKRARVRRTVDDDDLGARSRLFPPPLLPSPPPRRLFFLRSSPLPNSALVVVHSFPRSDSFTAFLCVSQEACSPPSSARGEHFLSFLRFFLPFFFN